MAPSNFNYTVELNKGLESLKQGRLRQAEQSFKYLVSKFPSADGGYRGLAKVHFEQEERDAALKVLREGAAALTRAGERTGAIGLLKEAIGLDPRDFGTHRRLAAALALVGDTDASIQEYARFIRDLLDNGEGERARNEIAYAKGQLRDAKGLGALDEILERASAHDEVESEPEPPTAPPTRDEIAHVAEDGGSPHRTEPVDPWALPRPERMSETNASEPSEASPDDPWHSPPPLRYERSTPTPELPEVELENDPWSAGSPSTAPDWVIPGAAAPTWAEPEQEPVWDPPLAEPEPLASVAPAAPEPAASSNGEPSVREDPVAVEEAAARFLATRDPRGARRALEVARYYIDEGRTDAASDLLLQLISSGVDNHDAQRLLIEITRSLGKRDVAKTKCQLLVQALRLDGRDDLADEIEGMALAD